MNMILQKFRKKYFPKLHPLGGYIGKSIIPPKGEERELIMERGDEYVLSVKCPRSDLVNALSDYGYLNNPISTLKFVEADDGRVWENGTMAYRQSLTGKWMHHAYWFPARGNYYTFHISQHKERNYLDISNNGPSEHMKRGEEYFEAGDPDNHLVKALDESDIEYEVLENELY